MATTGRKPMTDAEKKEKERIDAFDFGSLEAEEADAKALRQERKTGPNPMLVHLKASAAKWDDKGLGLPKAFTVPDEGIAKRIKSQLTSAAEAEGIGVTVKIKALKLNSKGEPTTKQRRVVFQARKDRKSYNRTNGDQAQAKESQDDSQKDASK